MNKAFIYLLSILVLLGNAVASDRPWKTNSFEYEGFPLYLRVPDGLNYEDLRKKYPKYISITHQLSEVLNNGLPEPSYNLSLFDFDGQLVNALENAGAGITVLVETFGGKRTYYMYSKDDFPPEMLREELNKAFPDYILEVSSYMDEDWSFIKRYAEDWGF